MMTTPLITYSQVTYKHITSNLPASKFNMYLEEAQELDVRPLLGDELYIDLLDEAAESPQFSTYSDLMNGSVYQYGTIPKRYKHEGLVAVLSYYTYSRYLASAGSNSTPFGMVEKVNEYSKPTSEKRIASLIAQAQSGGRARWERVQRFLIHKRADYPLYRSCSADHSTRGSGARVLGIGGNNRTKSRRRY